MQIAIHNEQGIIIDYMNNNVPGSLKYSASEFVRYLETGNSTLSLTIEKLNQYGQLHPRLKSINNQSSLSFTVNDRHYRMIIKSYTESDTTITIEAEDANLELLNETREEYEDKTGKSFVDHMAAMNLLDTTKVRLGLNEVSSYVRTAEFKDNSTILKRTLDLISLFDGEPEFVTHMFPDGTFDYIELNVYKKCTKADPDRGVGSLREDITLQYGRDVSGVTVAQDKTDLYTGLRVKSKSGEYFKPKKNVKIMDSSGKHIEVYMNRNNITAYAPLASLLYPATLNLDDCDPWIVRTVQAQTDNYDELLSFTLGTLLDNCYPKNTYTVELQANTILKKYSIQIGDSIFISDPNFLNGMLLRSRVSKISRSLDTELDGTPKTAQITFSTSLEIKRRTDSRLDAFMAQIKEEAKAYDLRIASSNGLIFKELSQSSTVTPTLYRGDDIVSGAMFKYYIDDAFAGSGESYTLPAAQIQNGTTVMLIEALVSGAVVSTQSLTFASVNDGISPIMVTINSTNGNIFKDGDISTILTAQVYRENSEIDTEGRAFKYIWTKNLKNGSPDTKWNEAHKESAKKLSLSSDDVYEKAVFTCSVDGIGG